jgi:hypothetical protein
MKKSMLLGGLIVGLGLLTLSVAQSHTTTGTAGELDVVVAKN